MLLRETGHSVNQNGSTSELGASTRMPAAV